MDEVGPASHRLNRLDRLSAAGFVASCDRDMDSRCREGECGCPLGSLSSELTETDEPARTALAASFERWEAPIRDGLRRMRDRGELTEETDVDELALATLAALQGGLLLTQVKRSVSPLEAALNLAISEIGHHLS
jgi:TetR/AcrR family transcriptional regulator, transcriptional repressor for nem operon